ncbi:hypothetical protein BKA80DRAFT_57396 [Phyllosticta citrichinensis]
MRRERDETPSSALWLMRFLRFRLAAGLLFPLPLRSISLLLLRLFLLLPLLQPLASHHHNHLVNTARATPIPGSYRPSPCPANNNNTTTAPSPSHPPLPHR